MIEVENRIDAHVSVEASDEAHVTKTVGDQTVHETTEDEEEPTKPVETQMPSVVTIFATAILEDSPNETLDNEELESLYRFVTSKDHLVKNIENIEFNYLSSRQFRSNKFKHTIQVSIKVKTASLWEGPRSYIWRHLGNDNTWARGNGSRFNLVKIHQK